MLCISGNAIRITGEMVFLEYAEKHSQLLPELIEKDTVYDLVYGNAGAVLVLCGMYELTSSEAYLRLDSQGCGYPSPPMSKSRKKGEGWPNRHPRLHWPECPTAAAVSPGLAKA